MTLNEFTQLAILVYIGIVAPLALLHLYSEVRTHRGLYARRIIQESCSTPPPAMPKTGFCTSNPTWLDLLQSAMRAQLKFREAELKEIWERLDKEDRQAYLWEIGERKKILRKLDEGRGSYNV